MSLAIEKQHGIGVYEPDHAEQEVLLEARLLTRHLFEIHRNLNTGDFKVGVVLNFYCGYIFLFFYMLETR